MTTLALLGLWLLVITLVLAFFAGARRVRDTAITAAHSASIRDTSQEGSIVRSMRESA